MGLLDVFNTLEGQQALGLLAAAGPRSDGAGFGQRLQEGLASADNWKARQQAAKMQEMQMQQHQSAMAEAQRKLLQQQQLEALAKKYSTPAGFDYKGYASEVAGIDPMKALSVSQSLLKDTPVDKPNPRDFTPQSVSMFVKSGNFSDLVPVQKEHAGTELNKLIAERDSFPIGSPNRKLYEQQIQKLTTHQPQVQVSYGAPVAGVDESGKPVFFQPSKDGSTPAIIPGVAPSPRPIPESVQQSIRENNVVLGKIDKAIEEVRRNPSAFGMQNLVGDAAMQRFDPAGVEARAIVADIGGQKIHDRSGAAVSVGEAERLKPYIPAATDKPETVAKKLKLFQAEYAAMQKELQGGASVSDASKGKTPIATKRFNPATGKLENVSN